MSFISKITNPLNHGQKLEDAKKEYNQKVEDFKDKQKDLEDSTFKLYSLRKESLKTLNSLNLYVNSLNGCPSVIQCSMKRALEYADDIRDAWDFENAPHTVNAETGNAADVSMMGAAAAGGAFAIGGPSAAMAIATTFGTASTGTAISSLGGAAATNAALAWLGGGTVATSGGGIVAGTSLLGALPFIGWGVAGVASITLLITSSLKKKKNDQTIEQIRKYSKELDMGLTKMKSMLFQLHEITLHTESLNNTIKEQMTQLSSDYSSEKYPHVILFESVSNAKNLGKLMKQSVNIN